MWFSYSFVLRMPRIPPFPPAFTSSHYDKAEAVRQVCSSACLNQAKEEQLQLLALGGGSQRKRARWGASRVRSTLRTAYFSSSPTRRTPRALSCSARTAARREAHASTPPLTRAHTHVHASDRAARCDAMPLPSAPARLHPEFIVGMLGGGIGEGKAKDEE